MPVNSSTKCLVDDKFDIHNLNYVFEFYHMSIRYEKPRITWMLLF